MPLSPSAAASALVLPCVCPPSLLPAPLPTPGVCPPPLPLAILQRSPSVPRPAPSCFAPRPARLPSPPASTTHRCSCGIVMSISVLLGVGAPTGRGRKGRGLLSPKAALGGYALGGLMWMWLLFMWVRYLASSLPSAAAARAPGSWPGEAPWVRVGPVPLAGGEPRAAACPAGAAVLAPCGLSGGVSGAPPVGGAAGAMAWAARAASPAGTGSGASGSESLGAPGAHLGFYEVPKSRN